MLQSVATLLSLLIAGGAIALIVGTVIDDWQSVVRTLRGGPNMQALPVVACVRSDGIRSRVQVVRIRSQSAPQRAAA